MSAYAATTDPTAVSGRRFGAYVVDGIIVAALSAGLFFATADLTIWEDNPPCRLIEEAGGYDPDSEFCIRSTDADDPDTTFDDDRDAVTFKKVAPFVAGGASLAYLILVQWILQAATGMTLGKAIFGIRTVDENGNAPGLGKQFIRGILWIVDGLCSGLVAAILILVTKGHRRLGDMAAKTFVVRSSAKGSPILVPGMESQPTPAYAGAGAAAGYTPPAPGATTSTPPAPGTAQTTPSEPTQTAQQPAADAGATTAQPSASGPQWDPSRNAYIQWDPSGNRWLTYDDAAGQWKPLEGEQPPPPPA